MKQFLIAPLFLCIFCLPFICGVPLKELPLVVIVTSYNNKDSYVKNLDSLFGQKYDNYRVIYIDDCSSDGTALLVESYIKDHDLGDRCLLIKNVTRRFKMANLWAAIQLCRDNEIIVEYDGDDWFSDNEVFALINHVYQSGNVLLTYSDLVRWPDGSPGTNKEIPQSVVEKSSYRTYKGCFWQMSRTYYAWLAKEIALKDLLFEGTFLTCTSDAVMMFCMMEMAAGRFAYIKKPIYVYNVANELNDHKVVPRLQKKIELLARQKPKYMARQRPLGHKLSSARARGSDMLIFAHDQPDKLKQLLEGVRAHMSELGIICVILDTSNVVLLNIYQELLKLFPDVVVVQSSQACAQVLNASRNDYLILAHEGIRILSSIGVTELIDELEKTKSYAFFLSCARQCAPRDMNFINLGSCVSAWQFVYGKGQLKNPLSTSLSMYRKNTVIPALAFLEYRSEPEFCYVWSQMASGTAQDTCLCYNDLHAVDVSMVQMPIYPKNSVFITL